MNKKEVGEGVPANTEMSQARSCFSEASWKFSPGTAQESNGMRTSSRSSSQTHLKLKSKSWLCRLWCWQQPQPALTHTQSRIFKCPLGSLSGTAKQGQLLPSLDEDQIFQLFFADTEDYVANHEDLKISPSESNQDLYSRSFTPVTLLALGGRVCVKWLVTLCPRKDHLWHGLAQGKHLDGFFSRFPCNCQ